MSTWLLAFGLGLTLAAIPIGLIAMMLLAGHARHRQRARQNREELQR